MVLIIIVAGTRPEFIKLVPIIRNSKRLKGYYTFIWSGQHYDYELSRVFFEEFGGLEPDYDLSVGSDSQGVQTAKIIQGVEGVLKRFSTPGIVVAVGDTNTVLGATLAAVKASWVFAHVEAGLRSFYRFMPEEINRVVADHVANVLFAPSIQAVLNLLYEGIDPWRIFLTGNTIVDAVRMILTRIEKERSKVLAEVGIEEPYALVTLHRAENVDYVDRLGKILKGLQRVSKEIRLVFPIHPRTQKKVKEFGLENILKGLKVVKPLGYVEFLSLLSGAEMVFTDSGGVQEEAFTLGIPCITLRRNTERPETVWLGGNILVGDDPERIVGAYRYVVEHREKIVRRVRNVENPYGDGKAGKRIAALLERLVEDKGIFNRFAYSARNEPDYRNSDYPVQVLVDGAIFESMRVEEIHSKYPGVFITLIYDEKGKPLIPYVDTLIRRGWKLRLWGPKRILESFLK